MDWGDGGEGVLIAYALRQIKAFSEVTHFHSDITGAMGTWKPGVWTRCLSKGVLWKWFLFFLRGGVGWVAGVKKLFL